MRGSAGNPVVDAGAKVAASIGHPVRLDLLGARVAGGTCKRDCVSVDCKREMAFLPETAPTGLMMPTGLEQAL